MLNYTKRFIVMGVKYNGSIEKILEADTREKAIKAANFIEDDLNYAGSKVIDMQEHQEEELKEIKKICSAIVDGITGIYGYTINKEKGKEQIEKAKRIFKSMKEGYNKERAAIDIKETEFIIRNY